VAKPKANGMRKRTKLPIETVKFQDATSTESRVRSPFGTFRQLFGLGFQH
jgi:hypothetical protein